jgi:hypothetical protein
MCTLSGGFSAETVGSSERDWSSPFDLVVGDGTTLKGGLLWAWAVALGLDDELVPVGGIEQGSEIVSVGAAVGLDRECDLLAAESTYSAQFNRSSHI